MLRFKWCDADEALDAVYIACLASDIKMGSKESTLEKMRFTDVLGVFNPDCIGAVMFKQQHFHGAILPDYRGKWMNKEFIKIVLDEKQKRGGLKTTINGAMPIVEKSVTKFCKKYGIEIINV